MRGRTRYLFEALALGVVGLFGLLFLGGRIAPCLGGPGPAQDAARQACAAAYVESLSPIDRFMYEYPTAAALAVIVVALIVVAAFELASRRRLARGGR